MRRLACSLAVGLILGSARPAESQTAHLSLFIERDSGGAYIRVEESRVDPLGHISASRVVRDTTLGSEAGASFIINMPGTVRIEHVVAERMKHGIRLDHTGASYIYDYRYDRFDGGGGIYGAAIKLGAGGATDGPTYLQRVNADGGQAPDASYHRSNTDFVGIETESGPVFIRDVTAANFGDAAIDAKSGPVYVLNATLSNTHRILRAWRGVQIVIVDSIVNAAPGHSQIWLADASASVRYHNVLWCQGADHPSADNPRCRARPWLVEGDSITPAQALAHVGEIDVDPPLNGNAFFAAPCDRIAIQFSSDRGAHWTTLDTPNAGDINRRPIGDLRYPIPPALDRAAFWFQAQCFNPHTHREPLSSGVINAAGVTIAR